MSIRGIKITMWICIAVLTLQFLGAGITKLTGSWTARFAGWGYSSAFMYVVGVLEVLGVAGLYIPKYRKWSAMLFILIMFGAAYTHISNSENPRLIHNAIMAGISLLIIQLNGKIRKS